MSNFFYDSALEFFANADIDWLVDTIRFSLVTAAYTPSVAHVYLSSVTGISSTTSPLTGKTSTAGRLKAANSSFSAVTSASNLYCICWMDTTVVGTSPLIACFDTATMGLPTGPLTGQNVLLNFHASGIGQI